MNIVKGDLSLSLCEWFSEKEKADELICKVG